jgi:hypothetical protein
MLPCCRARGSSWSQRCCWQPVAAADSVDAPTQQQRLLHCVELRQRRSGCGHHHPRIPGLAASAPITTFFAGFSPGALTGDPAVTPTPQLAAAAELQRLDTRAVAATRIEDPGVHTSATIDCVSCHLAQSLRTPALPIDIHMFSYQGSTSSIQPRTVQETAASVALANALLAAR